MSGKVKLSITTLCLSALALYHASTAWDTSLARLVYTAFGLACLTAAVLMSLLNKKLLLGAAAAAVAVLYGLFIHSDFANFDGIYMKKVIPDNAVVDYVSITSVADNGVRTCLWRPGEGEARIRVLNDLYVYITGGRLNDEELKKAVFYPRWIPKPTERIEPWISDLEVGYKLPDKPAVSIYISDTFHHNAAWDVAIDDNTGNNPYDPQNYNSFYGLTNADLSGLIPDDVAAMILGDEQSVAIPDEPDVNGASSYEMTEERNGNAELSTQMERTDEGELLINGTAKSQWVSDDIPDKMTVTAEVYAMFEGASEPVLLDSVTKEGENVKGRFFNIREMNLLEASPDGEEPVWVEVRLETVFTFGDKEQIVNNAVRYER